MSLRIPGAAPPPTPTFRRHEVARRPAPAPVDAPTLPSAPTTADTIGSASAPVSALATELKMAQWAPREEVSTPPPALPAAPAVSDGGAAYGGEAAAAPVMVPDQAQLTADLVRDDVLAQPPQASGIHGNLVAATVLNLLA